MSSLLLLGFTFRIQKLVHAIQYSTNSKVYKTQAGHVTSFAASPPAPLLLPLLLLPPPGFPLSFSLLRLCVTCFSPELYLFLSESTTRGISKNHLLLKLAVDFLHTVQYILVAIAHNEYLAATACCCCCFCSLIFLEREAKASGAVSSLVMEEGVGPAPSVASDAEMEEARLLVRMREVKVHF